jgi:hypothetical protein
MNIVGDGGNGGGVVDIVVKSGHFAILDEAERGVVVIPRNKLVELAEILPGLKEAD